MNCSSFKISKIVLVALLALPFLSNGQKTVIDKINYIINKGGCGVGNISMNYRSANYWSKESVLILKDTASSSIVRVHVSFADSNKVNIDTIFILNSTQYNNLLNFYNAIQGQKNPNTNLSAQHTGEVSLRVTLGCEDRQDVVYNSSLHISLYRTITGNWSSWYQ